MKLKLVNNFTSNSYKNSDYKTQKYEEKNSTNNDNNSKVQIMNVNSFATLLRGVNKINGIERIRFISPHPKDFTDDVIEAIKRL